MPCPCHALTMPFFSRPRHTTGVERRPVGYLPAFGFFRLQRGVPRRLLSEAYQSSSQRSIPTTVKSGSSTLQKRRSVKLSEWQFWYFRLPRGFSRRTRHCRRRAGARHGMCELTARHGRGTAWERHGRGMGTACYIWIGLKAHVLIVLRPALHHCSLVSPLTVRLAVRCVSGDSEVQHKAQSLPNQQPTYFQARGFPQSGKQWHKSIDIPEDYLLFFCKFW
jgi:hypothetical protein